MSVVIGTLTIDLKANTASFSQGMDKMSSLSAKTANDIKRSLEKVALAGAAMAAAITTGTVALIKSSLDAADSFGKFAQSAGTTTETLSLLNYAAGLSNVSTEQLVKGLEKLSNSAFKAQNGNQQLEKVFSKLGVTATDSNGRLQDSGLLLEQVAVKFAKMGDSAGKTALAQQLFGKSGASLIPMLNQYGAEQEKVNEEAHRFGLILGTDTAEVAARAHDNLDRLGFVFKGIGFSLLSATLPALDELLQKIIELAKTSDLSGLAKAFGGEVTKAVRGLGDALDFAVHHVEALKIALIGLASVQVAKIAIPVISDLAAGGISKVGEGISRMLISFAGLSKVIPALTAFAGWVSYTTRFLVLMAQTEGTAAAATYALDGALAVIGGPVTLIIAAVAGLVALLYKFRDATFSLGSSTYELRDTWNAAWLLMGKSLSWVGSQFGSLISWLKSLWSGFITWFSGLSIIAPLQRAFEEAFSWAKGLLGKLTPQFAVDALNQAKAEREAREKKAASSAPPPTAKGAPNAAPDTSGMGVQKQNPVTVAMANLNEKLLESQQTLAAAGLEEEAQRKVNAANEANNEILKLGQQIAKERGVQTSNYAGMVDAATQATIRATVAQISENKARTELTNTIGAASRATALDIAQSDLMIEAMNKGAEAVMRQTALTQALNELRAKGGSDTQIRTRAEELYNQAVAKERVDITANIISMQQDTAARDLVTNSLLDNIDAERQASLQAKLYVLDQKILGTEAGSSRDALLAQRDAIISATAAENAQADAQNALALLSPAQQYERETDALNHAVAALAKMQGGTLTYGQSLTIAAKQQDDFNRLTDETVNLLLRFGDARDGVTAFFLEMQKQAESTASIVYQALNSAFDKLSDNLTELITGGKADFGKMFEDIGKQMVKSTIQQQLQKGLGALGGLFGIGVSATKPDGTKTNPFYVTNVGLGFLGGGSDSDSSGGYLNELGDWIGGNAKKGNSTDAGILSKLGLGGLGGMKSTPPFLGSSTNELGDVINGSDSDDDSDSSGSGLLSKLGGLFGKSGDSSGGSSIFTSLFSKLGGLFGKGDGDGDGGGIGSIFSSIFSSLIPHASGGPVTPGSAYLVGERGPEILTGISGNIISNTSSQRMLGANAASSVYYTIDARGTDPAQTEQRTRQAILASHNSAVTNAVQVNNERLKRVPQR